MRERDGKGDRERACGFNREIHLLGDDVNMATLESVVCKFVSNICKGIFVQRRYYHGEDLFFLRVAKVLLESGGTVC
jgi:hypothetical protein